MAIESGRVAGQELFRERPVYFVKEERNTEMTKLGFTLTFLTVVVCSLFPAGCDRGKEQQALEAAAKVELTKERDEAIGELRNEIADLTIAAAEKVIEQSLDKEAHRKLIDKVLEESETLRKR